MTIPHLPTVSLGNLATDISGAAAGFVKGLQAEKQRRQEEMMKQALLQVQMLRATRPESGDTQVIQVPTPEGLKYATYNKVTHQTEFIPAPAGASATGPGTPAPLRQFVSVGETPSGDLTQLTTPTVALPGGPPHATQVQLPPGQQPRDISPAVMPVETPGGPAIARIPRRKGAPEILPGAAGGGESLQPRATEAQERRARDAFQMVQSKNEMQRIVTSDPKGTAYNEAASYIAALDIGDGIPLAGDVIASIIRNAQSALTPAAAQYFSAFMQAAAAQAFSRGGATLTKNEIDYSLASLAPKPGEDPTTTAMRERLWSGIIGSNIVGNPAWLRYKDFAKQLGFTDPLDNIVAPAPKPAINPRFDPRTQQRP